MCSLKASGGILERVDSGMVNRNGAKNGRSAKPDVRQREHRSFASLRGMQARLMHERAQNSRPPQMSNNYKPIGGQFREQRDSEG